jgi:hypothetical protein
MYEDVVAQWGICDSSLVEIILFKGIVSPDWKGLQMVSLDRFEV